MGQRNGPNRARDTRAVFLPHANKRDRRTLESQADVQEIDRRDISINQQQVQDSAIVRPPPSSQTNESITAKYKYKLVIKSKVNETVYIGKPIGTTEGNGITVAVVNLDGHQVPADHHLAKVKVELVVVDADFYDNVDDWTKDEFEKSLIEINSANEKTKKAIFQLKDGKGVHGSTTIHKSSKRKHVRLGVKIYGDSTERVLEGVSNGFFVQHWRPTVKKTGQESLTIPGITQNSPKKNAGGKRRTTTNTQLRMPNALAPASRSRKQATSRDSFEGGTTSNGHTEMNATIGPPEETDDESLVATTGGEAPNKDSHPHLPSLPASVQSNQAVQQAAPPAGSMQPNVAQDGNSNDTGMMVDGVDVNTYFNVSDQASIGSEHLYAPEGNRLPISMEQNQSNLQNLASEILNNLPSIREIVPPGNQQLLNKIYNLDVCLRHIYGQLHPQAQERNTGNLQICHGAAGETMTPLLMYAAVNKGLLMDFFRNLHCLQQALEQMIVEMARPTNADEVQTGLGGNIGNGTGDQNLGANSNAIACEDLRSMNNPHAMQVNHSAGAHHSSALRHPFLTES